MRILQISSLSREHHCVYFLDGFHVYNWKKKVYLTPPPINHGLLHFQTIKSSILPPELFKTVYFTPRGGFRRWFCYSNGGCYGNVGFVFSFFIYFRWILKNHSKSQKFYKNGKSNFVGLHMSRSTQWIYNIVRFSIKFLL